MNDIACTPGECGLNMFEKCKKKMEWQFSSLNNIKPNNCKDGIDDLATE